MVVVDSSRDRLSILRCVVIVRPRPVTWSTSQHVIGEQPTEQHNVNDPHYDHRRQQYAEIERRHAVPIDKQAVAYEYHAERKATHDERCEIHVTYDPVQWMLESKVHYLHQLPQVKEDTVNFDYQPHDCVSNELTIGNTICQATYHLHVHIHTNYNYCQS